jgi:Fe-S cluster biogenesis protein NfuA
MNGKRIMTVILLVFVVFSIGMIIKKETNKSELNLSKNLDKTQTVVYYFHGTKRCKTCNTIETYTKESIQKNFAKEIQNNELKIQSINVEHAGNEHFVKDFQLSMKTVVVVNYVDGEIVTWKNCDKVWKLVGDKETFKTYIANETKSILEG